MIKKLAGLLFAVLLAFTTVCFACTDDDFYTVRFDADGGTLSFNSINLHYGDQVSLPTGEKEGYRLCCFIFEYGARKYVFDAGKYSYHTGIKVKAVWADEKDAYGNDNYIITYLLNGGILYSEGDDQVPYFCSAETETFTLKNPTKTGCWFKGWKKSGSTDQPDPNVVIEKGTACEDVTYIAEFQPAVYKVNLVLETRNSVLNPATENTYQKVTCRYHGKTTEQLSQIMPISVSYGNSIKVDAAVSENDLFDFLYWEYYDKNTQKFVKLNVYGEEDPLFFNENNFDYDFEDPTPIDIYVVCVGRYSPFI